MISFFCTFCHQKLKANENLAGRTIKCPTCRETTQIPQTSAPAPQNVNSAPKLDTQKLDTRDIAAAIPTGKEITCPHCFQKFRMSELLFIATHPDLVGDTVLGAEAPIRFSPTSLDANGYAIDAKGMSCPDMACPRCHLAVPANITDYPAIYFSVVGAPSAGKSYYLTAMTWQLRRILAESFDYAFSDTNTKFNATLNGYESLLFLNMNKEQIVALPKTELQGTEYSSQIVYNGMRIDLPKPFIFTLKPSTMNPRSKKPQGGVRNIVVYDNAGEHYEPGQDQAANFATKHLQHASGITFLFDPVKDARMISRCSQEDPQVSKVNRSVNQIILLQEMIARIKKYANIRGGEKFKTTLVVVIPKYDAWKDDFPLDLAKTEFTYFDAKSICTYLNLSAITNVSYVMRKRLLQLSPDVVSTCEEFFERVYYIPTSSLGRMPVYDEQTSQIGIRPDDLKPIWAEVPMLLQMHVAGLLSVAHVPGSVAAGSELETIAIQNCQFVDNFMTYVLPGGNKRETTPTTFCGCTVYDESINKFLRFPLKPKTESAAAAKSAPAANGAGLDDFWN